MTSNRPLRVSLISHIYLEPRNRTKLPLIGTRVSLTVIAPHQFRFPYGMYRADFSDAHGYAARVYRCVYPALVRTSTRWALWSTDLGFRSSKPDIIHVENEIHSFSLLQALICRRIFSPRAPVVAFVWANQRVEGVKGLFLRPLARLARLHVDHFIAGSRQAQQLLVSEGVPERKITMMPSIGIDGTVDHESPKEGIRKELGIASDEFVVGFVGRFAPEKGIVDLVEACESLRKSLSRSVRLLFVGDGPLKSQLESLGRTTTVISPGERAKALRFYAAMDVLVLPSRTTPAWTEQLGLVLVEAMAHGVPVIGSSSGAIPEVIGDAGMVFEEGAIDSLVQSLRRLAEERDLGTELSRRGRHRAAEFTDERIAERTLALYASLASDFSRGQFNEVTDDHGRRHGQRKSG